MQASTYILQSRNKKPTAFRVGEGEDPGEVGLNGEQIQIAQKEFPVVFGNGGRDDVSLGCGNIDETVDIAIATMWLIAGARV